MTLGELVKSLKKLLRAPCRYSILQSIGSSGLQRVLMFFLMFFYLTPWVSQANIVGTDAQNFNTVTSGLDFVTVQSSETLEPGVYNVGFYVNFAQGTLPTLVLEGEEEVEPNDTILASELNMGMGILKGWDFGISFPVLLSQTVDDTKLVGLYDKLGMTEVRVNTKYQMFGNDRGGGAVIATVNLLTIENNPYMGLGGGPILDLEFAFDFTVHNIAMGFNMGYRMRNPGDPLEGATIQPLADQITASMALSFLLTKRDTKLIFEVFGSQPAGDGSGLAANADSALEDFSSRSLQTLEMIFGAKHDFNRNLSLHVGGGSELVRGTASSDYRVYLGVNWATGHKTKVSSHRYYKRRRAKSRRRFKKTGNQGDAGKVFFLKGGRLFDLASKEINDEDRKNLPRVLVTPRKVFLDVFGDVLFGFDSFKIQKGAFTVLDDWILFVKNSPGFAELLIHGHTDSVGSADYNLTLSQKRADTIKKYLVRRLGASSGRIVAKGFGESKPIASNGNFQGKRLNRRVSFILVKTEAVKTKRKKRRKKKRRKKKYQDQEW